MPQTETTAGDTGTTGRHSRSKSVTEIGNAYDEMASTIERFEFVERALTGRYRARQFGNAEGRVLDVACGTGNNFRHLPDDVDLVGIDVSAGMLSVARSRLSNLALDGRVERMDAQELEFADDSFDTVISALSTCTFPDPDAALREMRRVCRPGGRILLLEHGRSHVGPIARYQEFRADAKFRRSGCRSTQDPLEVVSGAGLSVDDHWNALFGILTGIEVRV